jgi:hypothetical protein
VLAESCVTCAVACLRLGHGSLTQSEYDALKTSSEGLKAELAQAQKPEAKKAAKLEALSKNVFTERHDGELDAGKRIESFAARISAGLDDKSLTTREATRLAESLGSLYADRSCSRGGPFCRGAGWPADSSPR